MSTFTTLEKKLLDISPDLEAVVSVLQVAQSVTGLGGTAAATGLKVLDGALKALMANAGGELTHEQMMAEIQKAHETLRAERIGDDLALAAKAAPA